MPHAVNHADGTTVNCQAVPSHYRAKIQAALREGAELRDDGVLVEIPIPPVSSSDKEKNVYLIAFGVSLPDGSQDVATFGPMRDEVGANNQAAVKATTIPKTDFGLPARATADAFECIPADPTWHTIRYEVSGSYEASTITYENVNGDSSQSADADLPWGHVFKDSAVPRFLYVSAQNAYGGRITCSIYVDGVLKESNSSTGRYAICTAST